MEPESENTRGTSDPIRKEEIIDRTCAKVLVFSGTSEGKEISRWLKDNDLDVTVSVATEYGSRDSDDDLDVHFGSYGGIQGIADEIHKQGYTIVIDATHPFATSISTHVKEACDMTSTRYMRISRKDSVVSGMESIQYVEDVDDAVRIISGTAGKVLVTTGMKELHKFTAIPNYRERIIARVLSVRDSVLKALDLGFDGANLICARGPFSEEYNHALIKQTNASMLVTKDTGSEGGFIDKIRAAEKAGIRTLVIRRPKDSGISVDQAINTLSDLFSIAPRKKRGNAIRTIAIVGIGMGWGTVTQDACVRIESADLLIGADRILSSVHSAGKDILREYRADHVLDYLNDHPEYERPVVLVSGDVGFYSAAKNLLERIDRDMYRIEIYCGIPSLVYLCSRIGMPWQDIRLLSAHGRDANVVGSISSEYAVFTLLTGSDGARHLCDDLIRYGMDDVRVVIGQDLGSATERLFCGKPSELRDKPFSELCAAIVINDEPDRRMPIGMDDDDFIRGSAPMTKSEVRSLSIVKLKLNRDSIVYDIGAGTGSVSIEMARVAREGRIYAIEKDNTAIDLIECNKRKFATPNVYTITGMAPDAFMGLPTPTHAFIGGSSGRMEAIVEGLLKLNPDVRIVINAVTLETIGEISGLIGKFGFSQSEIVHLSISKAKELGKYHLMTAQNPIYVVTVQR